MTAEQSDTFKIIGIDDVIYGPVELPELINWVHEERVNARTWVYVQSRDEWQKAKNLAELRMFFGEGGSARAIPDYDTDLMSKAPALKPGTLRRIKVFAGFSDSQLARFVKYIQIREVKQFSEVVRQGEPGDAMFMLLQGEVRVRMLIGGKESLLT